MTTFPTENAAPVVLGVETSCDETGIGIVRGHELLANIVYSQVAEHARFGGVIPELAGRSHLERILPLLDEALERAGIQSADVDAIAVTNRPGLVGCLLVGISVAKTLALLLDKPLIGIDHLQAHVDAAFLADPDIELPLITLVASGGHTSIYACSERGHAERLGATRDDAAGEALDKAAALLGLGYPGGPALETCAKNGRRDAVRFKRTMLGKDSLDFSFSGLKTALLYHLRGPGLTRPMPELDDAQRADLAASFQEAVFDVLVTKLAQAARDHDARFVAIGGGVARNQRLREKLASHGELAARKLLFPPLDLCSDNGAMIAGLGALRHARGEHDTLDLEAYARSEVSRAARNARHGDKERTNGAARAGDAAREDRRAPRARARGDKAPDNPK